jgi:hypothetical protein
MFSPIFLKRPCLMYLSSGRARYWSKEKTYKRACQRPAKRPSGKLLKTQRGAGDITFSNLQVVNPPKFCVGGRPGWPRIRGPCSEAQNPL